MKYYDHVDLQQIHQDIQEAIDAAWEQEDPAARQLQEKLFPEGKPTPAEFISTIARYVKSKMER